MREDRLFRNYFDNTAIKEKPVNPWRTAPSKWREEEKPGRFSVLVYVIAAAGLFLCIALPLAGRYQDPNALGVARHFDAEQLREQIQVFLDRCAASFHRGFI